MKIWVVTAALMLLAGCGKSGVGEDCTDSAQCGEGTSCVQYGGKDITNNELACTNKRVCSVTCALDTDCATLGTGYICVSDCYAGSCLKGTRG